MTNRTHETASPPDLRTRAAARLAGQASEDGGRTSGVRSLAVLYDLASSSATAPAALALLHELQVHQVELEMQDEELREARSDLETALRRSIELWDHAPVACLTIDAALVVHELNLAAAALLGEDRAALVGRSLDVFLAPGSASALATTLTMVGTEPPRTVEVLSRHHPAQRMVASVKADPAGGAFLVALAAPAG